MQIAVDIKTVAFATVYMDISDDELATIATLAGKSVDELTADDLYDRALDYDEPLLCAECSGLGERYSLHLDADWEIDDNEGRAAEDRGIRLIDGV